jgi:hypothetical protein
MINWVALVEQTVRQHAGADPALVAEQIRREFVAHEVVVADAGWLADVERVSAERLEQVTQLQDVLDRYGAAVAELGQTLRSKAVE